MTFRYLSVCSGIEAATQAWHPLGWQCAGVSEIEKFPRAVLEQRLGAQPVDDHHRYREGSNTVPLFGDFTKIEAHHVGPVDLLVGGTPCQSFSVAGKRLGLDDPRGNLTLEFLALAKRVRPTWIVWENVPGVLSHDEGRTMGTFLRLVGECGFRWAYRVLDAQYVRTRAFPWAVPQRRRRVFLVGYSGTGGIDPRAVLFDRESLRGNPAPRREAGQGVTPTIAARTKGGGGLGTDFDLDGGLRAVRQEAFNKQALGIYDDEQVASTVSARDYKDATDLVAHSLRGEGFDASEDGTGHGTPIVPVQATRECAAALTSNYAKQPDNSDTALGPNLITIQERAVSENPDAGPDGKGWRDDGAAYTLEARQRPQAIAFSFKDSGNDAALEHSPTLRSLGAYDGNGGSQMGVAFDMRGREGGAMPEGPHETANIRAADGGSSRSYVAANWRVRRLTPVECERLQGFPDDFTKIEWRGKPADKCPDGPRYKSLGNSMACNVMGWLGERIELVRGLE